MKKFKGALVIANIFWVIGLIFILDKGDNNEFYDFLQNLNEVRGSFINNSQPVDLTQYMKVQEDEKTFISDEEVETLTTLKMINKKDEQKLISHKGAKEDISYVFEILKYSYGPYEYFGGDKVFNVIEEEILNKLSYEEKITKDKIKDLLVEGLEPVINDGHFRIGIRFLNNSRNLISALSREYYFMKENEKVYTFVDNEKYYLEEIDGSKDIQKYLKPSIDEKGKLVYVIGELLNNTEALITREISLVNKNNDIITKEITLKANYMNNKNGILAYEEYDIDGIPVLDVSSMNLKSTTDESLYTFIDSGKKYENEEIIIIDLRGNNGGSESYGKEWIKNYLGNELKITRSTIQKRSKINILASINHYEKMEGKLINQEEHLKAMKEDFEKGNYGTWYSGYDEGKFIENDNLIFVLIDQDVASAGEGFVDRLRYIENVVFIGGNTPGYDEGKFIENDNLIFVLIDQDVASAGEGFVDRLRYIENVVFIGGNTRGCYLVPNNYTYQLPNSKLDLGFGEGVFIGAEGEKYIENVVFIGGNTRGCYLVPNNYTYQLPNSKLDLGFGEGVFIGAEGENLDAEGFKPDIWIDSADALNATVKLIKNYKLD